MKTYDWFELESDTPYPDLHATCIPNGNSIVAFLPPGELVLVGLEVNGPWYRWRNQDGDIFAYGRAASA